MIASETIVPESAASCPDPEATIRIGELSKQFNVTLRALRFYETKGLLSPQRDGATRLYTSKDASKLALILMGRRIGFSLREVKQILEMYDPNGTNGRQFQFALRKSERQMIKLVQQQEELTASIKELEELTTTLRMRLSAIQRPMAA
ncbi:MerR family transcriptional regulator [Limoniibacter endophyticus]|uniref:Transcriptional regulator n=1 Tax=Limoniibacter endophyticus TaxID=1565040 RepID=A0A8J3DH46_9HYPH|nr:MerR family DNA-binding transcriptional regulator [Limoniibacter endophyticus]GHC66505.1 transcriptional regulator [Limoniibacter endophyticus]